MVVCDGGGAAGGTGGEDSEDSDGWAVLGANEVTEAVRKVMLVTGRLW